MRSDASFNPRRRAFLAAAGAAGLVGCFRSARIEPFCPEDPRYSDAKTPLTIDVHAHVFNASDLQVREFIQRVVLKQKGPMGDAARVLSGLLQSVSWELAPSAG